MRSKPLHTAVMLATLSLCLLWFAPTQALATHVGCGDTITADTTLDSDLVDCPGDGIIIGADGITLDLNGHSVDGDAIGYEEAGIRNGIYGPSGFEGHDDVTIENGTVSSFSFGVFVTAGTRNVVRGLRVRDGTAGVTIYSDGNRVVGNVTSGFDRGISIDGHDNLVQRNTVSASFHGIFVDYSGNRVERNLLFGNHSGVLILESSDTNYTVANEAFGNQIGIEAVEAVHDRIERNVLHDNLVGLETGTTYGLEVMRNQASQNVQDGILIADPDEGTTVKRNIANRNGDDGIDVESPSTTLKGNHARGNGDLGIEAVPGVIDGGQNRASGNGNPLQCLYVACK